MNNKNRQHPSQIAEFLLRRVLPEREQHDLLGDYAESFQEIAENKGGFIAGLWYWMQIFSLIPRSVWNSVKWSIVMIHNYLKIAFRNLKRHKGYSFINIFGLAMGIACCLVILMHIRFESSYDNYHQDAERVYRIGIDIYTPAFKRTFALVSYFEAPYLKENFPQVEAVTRFRNISGILVRRGDRRFYETDVVMADNDIFHVLTFPFRQGDPETALIRPGTVVVSESVGRKYFGDESPMGQTILVGDRERIITGVMADSPKNTHLKFGLIASMIGNEAPEWARQHWSLNVFYTYVKFRPDVDTQGLLPKIESGANTHRTIKAGERYTYFLQPLRDIHLHSHIAGEFEPPGNPTYLFIFGVIAGFILIIAGINYINLSTARSATRTREVGMRKIVGAHPKQLIVQFLGESLTATLLAVFLACLIVIAFLPFYQSLTGIQYTLKDLMQLDFLIFLIGIVLFSGVIAGCYPAFYLSVFGPIAVLKGRQGARLAGNKLRRALVVGQFVVSFILIAGTIVVSRQINYMKNKSLGFEKEQKVVIPLRSVENIREHFEAVKTEFLKYSGITGAAVSSGVPGRLAQGAHVHLVGEAEDMGQWMYYLFVDTDFLREYGITLAAGRSFQKELVSDQGSSFIVNETAVNKFGWGDSADALGKILWSGYGGEQGQIVGVVKDFHFFGLQQEIGPMVINIRPDLYRFLTLTLSTENIEQAVSSMKNTWASLFPGIPFDYFFLDNYFDRFYRNEEKVAALVRMFAMLAITIACLGILGLTAYTTERRKKEVGIRKAIGASAADIAALLTGEFMKWIVFAELVALPIAYAIFHKWLYGFAYRVGFSLWFFLVPSILMLGLAALTVSYLTLKAATANPVDSLRYE